MTTLPAGRELDRAVAEAMGVLRVTRLYRDADYSTAFGPHTQTMIDWLVNGEHDCPNVCDLRLTIDEGGAYAWLDEVKAWADYGWSLPEALARLVVAVAEARKEAGDG